jgi:hypothetical protein
MAYEHTQRGLWHLLLFAVAAGCLIGGWLLRQDPPAHYIFLGIALLMILIGLSFMQLTIRDEEDALAARFGPLPFFFTRIPYDRIERVTADRTWLLEGWGIHYLPRRGTTYNIWGFQCVRIDLDSRTIRLGTDDADNLIAFLTQRVESLTSRNVGDVS